MMRRQPLDAVAQAVLPRLKPLSLRQLLCEQFFQQRLVGEEWGRRACLEASWRALLRAKRTAQGVNGRVASYWSNSPQSARAVSWRTSLASCGLGRIAQMYRWMSRSASRKSRRNWPRSLVGAESPMPQIPSPGRKLDNQKKVAITFWPWRAASNWSRRDRIPAGQPLPARDRLVPRSSRGWPQLRRREGVRRWPVTGSSTSTKGNRLKSPSFV